MSTRTIQRHIEDAYRRTGMKKISGQGKAHPMGKSVLGRTGSGMKGGKPMRGEVLRAS